MNIFKFLRKNKPNAVEFLTDEVYTAYRNKITNTDKTESEILKTILLDRYRNNKMLFDLAVSNSEYLTDLQAVIHCILNMEFPNGKDPEQLADLSYIALRRLNSLGFQPARKDCENIDRLIENARIANYDVDAAVRYCLKTQMHKRPDFDKIMTDMFKS
jgi:hypothetical protein